MIASKTIHSKTLDIGELGAFSKGIKLSMHASVLRLAELGIYPESAVGAWQRFVKSHSDPEIQKRGGGKRTDEWKYKLSKYGFKFAEIFGEAKNRGTFDELELYQLSGIKPKFQKDYLQKAVGARPEDAEDTDVVADDEEDYVVDAEDDD
jgi:hypothetical protein